MVAHSALTGADLHEPKGVAGASADQVYTADGGGSGAWELAKAKNKVYLQYNIIDITAADSYWVVSPVAGTVSAIASVLGAGSGALDADTTVSFEIGGTAITSGNLTLTASGSAEGDIDTSTPSANNTVTANSAIEIISDGAASAGGAVFITLEITLT